MAPRGLINSCALQLITKARTHGWGAGHLGSLEERSLLHDPEELLLVHLAVA